MNLKEEVHETINYIKKTISWKTKDETTIGAIFSQKEQVMTAEKHDLEFSDSTFQHDKKISVFEINNQKKFKMK